MFKIMMLIWKKKVKVDDILKLASGQYHIRKNPPKGIKRKKAKIVPSPESNLVHVLQMEAEDDLHIPNLVTSVPVGGFPIHPDEGKYKGNVLCPSCRGEGEVTTDDDQIEECPCVKDLMEIPDDM